MTSLRLKRVAAVIARFRARLGDAGPRLRRRVRERPRELFVNLLLCLVIVALAAHLLPVSRGLTLAIASLALIGIEHRRELGGTLAGDRARAAGGITRGDPS